MDCEPVLEYGRARSSGSTPETATTRAGATSPDSSVAVTLTTDMLLGFEGGQASARTMLKEGDSRFVALSWGGAKPPTTYEDAYPAAGVDRPSLAALAGARQVPGPPVAQLSPAQRPDPPRAHLRPDRRRDGGQHDVVARDPGRRPQLRLPVRLDPRRDVRPVGDVLPRLRLGGRRLLLLHRRHRRGRRRPADHVRHRGRARPDRVDARPPARVRRLAAGADRQRGVRPEAARRLGRPAGLGLPARPVRRPPRQPDLADPRQAGGPGAEALARAGRRDLGGAGRAQALHVLEDHVLGRRRPRGPAGPDER